MACSCVLLLLEIPLGGVADAEDQDALVRILIYTCPDALERELRNIVTAHADKRIAISNTGVLQETEYKYDVIDRNEDT